eukprot:2665397-Pyramimonas_sp.AAC.2
MLKARPLNQTRSLQQRRRPDGGHGLRVRGNLFIYVRDPSEQWNDDHHVVDSCVHAVRASVRPVRC